MSDESMSDEELKIDARTRAVEAAVDYARSCGWDSPIVTGYLVVVECMTETGRGVIWLTGDGAPPTDSEPAGLKRWQVRGLISEVEADIVERYGNG